MTCLASSNSRCLMPNVSRTSMYKMLDSFKKFIMYMFSFCNQCEKIILLLCVNWWIWECPSSVSILLVSPFVFTYLLLSFNLTFVSLSQPPLRPSLACWSLTVRRRLWRFLLFSTTTRSEYPVRLSERHLLSYKHSYICPLYQDIIQLDYMYTCASKISIYPIYTLRSTL